MSTAIYLRGARNDRCQLDTQTQRLHAYAAENDLTIITTFYDVGRGTGRDRPGLSHMLAAARAGRFDRLLVDRLDRVSRRAHDLAGVLDDFDHAAVTLHSPPNRHHHDHPRRPRRHPHARRHHPQQSTCRG